MKMKDKYYSHEEIVEMFRNCEDLDLDFRHDMIGYAESFFQSMWNAVHEPEKTMKFSNPEEITPWDRGHNFFVQKYFDQKKIMDKKKRKSKKIHLKDLGGCDKLKECFSPQFFDENNKPIYCMLAHLNIDIRPVEEGSFFELDEVKRKEFSKQLLTAVEETDYYHFYYIQESWCQVPETKKWYYGYMVRGSRKIKEDK